LSHSGLLTFSVRSMPDLRAETVTPLGPQPPDRLAALEPSESSCPLTSYLATARTREIGVRMALGASRRDVLALLMRGGLVSTAAGIMAGALAALALIQVARSAIPELQTPDVRVLPAVLLPLAVAAVAGAGLPSLGAARNDPAEALRQN
jgi:hypothetical protein